MLQNNDELLCETDLVLLEKFGDVESKNRSKHHFNSFVIIYTE
ncbi:hypothetical protein [Clostridium sp.]